MLLVDDEESIQRMLAVALERDGFRVVPALDAASGLRAFRAEHPDVVLLDVMLPDLSGREVCRLLRAESNVPIIMLTALDDEVDKVVGLELGADDYITKPFGLRELRSRVRAVLRRASIAAPAREAAEEDGERLLVNGVELDRARRTVRADDAEVTLTYVEFELLATLLAQPGRVWSRAQLLDAIWGSADYRDQRTIDVHVRHLREKLERDPGAPERILTVRGVGYRFAERSA